MSVNFKIYLFLIGFLLLIDSEFFVVILNQEWIIFIDLIIYLMASISQPINLSLSFLIV